MSSIWNYNSSSSRKRRLSQIDDAIECLTQEVNALNNFVDKTEFECCLMIMKKKREKIKVLSGIAKSKELLAKTAISIAEGDLLTDIERFNNSKRTKLDRNEGKSQVNTPSRPYVSPSPTTATVSVQTTESMSNMENETRHSPSRTSPVDNSLDEPIHDSRPLVCISPQLVSFQDCSTKHQQT